MGHVPITFRVRKPGSAVQVVPCTGPLIQIGSASTAQVVVDELPARVHAIVRTDGDTVWVTDVSGDTGLRLNGRRIAGREALQSGDVLEIGTTRLEIALGAADSMTPQVARVKTDISDPAAVQRRHHDQDHRSRFHEWNVDWLPAPEPDHGRTPR